MYLQEGCCDFALWPCVTDISPSQWKGKPCQQNCPSAEGKLLALRCCEFRPRQACFPDRLINFGVCWKAKDNTCLRSLWLCGLTAQPHKQTLCGRNSWHRVDASCSFPLLFMLPLFPTLHASVIRSWYSSWDLEHTHQSTRLLSNFQMTKGTHFQKFKMTSISSCALVIQKSSGCSGIFPRKFVFCFYCSLLCYREEWSHC